MVGAVAHFGKCSSWSLAIAGPYLLLLLFMPKFLSSRFHSHVFLPQFCFLLLLDSCCFHTSCIGSLFPAVNTKGFVVFRYIWIMIIQLFNILDSRCKVKWLSNIPRTRFWFNAPTLHVYRVQCISRGGEHAGHAVLLVSACQLPERARRDYGYVMDNLFLWVGGIAEYC